MTQQLTWIGSFVGDFIIDSLLGGGNFSWVYSGLHSDGTTHKAFKVARPSDLIEDHATGWFPTKALVQNTGAIAEIQPDTHELLRIQEMKLKTISDPAFPKVEDSMHQASLTWYRMPLIAGNTLRQTLLDKTPISTATVIDLLLTLQRVGKDPGFDYHGDLKPENVMLSDNGIKLLDPGYFGQIKSERGIPTDCVITTPMYYPSLSPDDLFATGLVLWEIATGSQPLGRRPRLSELDLSTIDDNLLNLVKAAGATGNQYFNGLLIVPANPTTNPALNTLLLKALRLRILPNGKVSTGEGFRDYAELADAVAVLQSRGLANFSAQP